MKFLPTSRSRWLLLVIIIGVSLPVGYRVARHYAWPAYKNWRQAKLEKMTQTFMAARDYDNALLTARQALRDNQRNVALWRLAASAAAAKNTPDAIYYQANLVRLETSLSNQLELIRLALKYDDYRDAIDAIENITPKAKDNAEFHELAARTYLAISRPVPAKVHLNSLVSLRPDDAKARLDLAEIELKEDTDHSNSSLRAEIFALSKVAELHIRALEMLLRDSIAAEDPTRSVELAKLLRQSADLSGEQRVLVLAGLTEGHDADAPDYRRELQTAFLTDPKGAVALAKYYQKTGLTSEARKWFDRLPDDVRKNLGVQEAVATAYLQWGDWVRLDQALAGSQWKEREFMRHAYTAYSARKNGRMADAGNAWRLAVIQAGDSIHNTSELLTLVAKWGWQSEQYDLVWKLFALMPRNETISGQLIAWEHFQGHTSNLNRIFARLVEFSGDDRMLKNNFAYSSLLLDANLSKAYEIAQVNYKAEPANPYFVTTEALALYKQGKAPEALALMQGMRPAALSVPERAMYLAVYRAATGDASGAADLLGGLKAVKLLPEERSLVSKATQDIAKLNGQKGQDLRLDALDSNGGIDRNKGWLRSLPEAVRKAATPEMLATDSLFAVADYHGLGVQLHKGNWGEQEHLRLALIAYLSRIRADEGAARSYWRTALGSAGGSESKLKELGALAGAWNWQLESIEVLSRVYEFDPTNLAAFNQLMTYYRSVGRTADLVTVLEAYVSAHPREQGPLCDFAYYSMLSGLNVSRAYVSAQETYRAAPHDPVRRLVYSFALWKQHRPQEAWDLMQEVRPEENALVPAALLRAAVLADMERRTDAAEALKVFDQRKALPEETTLASVVASKLKTEPTVSGG
jgi:hypothetical protein